MSRYTKIEIWLGRFFICLLAIGLVLVAVEWSARALHKHQVSRYYMPQFQRPYVMYTSPPHLWNHNRLGYVGELPSLPKSADEFRIFMFGGSTVYGNDGTPLPELLEKSLTEKVSHRIRVYNFGVPGSVGRQDVMRLLVDGLGLQPDMVVFYGGGNDVLPSYDKRPNYPFRYFFHELNPALNESADQFPFWNTITLSSEFLRQIFGERLYRSLFAKGFSKSGRLDRPDVAHLRAKGYISNMQLAKSVAATYQIHFVNVLQPIAVAGLKNPELYNSQYQYIREALKGSQFLDLSRLFEDSTEKAFKDFIHLKSASERQVAATLTEMLKPILVLALKHPAPKNPLPPETDFLLDGQ